MGMIYRLIEFFRRETPRRKTSFTRGDSGGGIIHTTEYFQPAGDDAQPMSSDMGVEVPTRGAEQYVSMGFVDPRNAGITEAGEKRIYARDQDGNVVVDIYLQRDGSLRAMNENGIMHMRANGSFRMSNSNGQAELQQGGDFVVNGARITAAGEIINAGGIVLGTHVHPYTWEDGPGGGSTNPPA